MTLAEGQQTATEVAVELRSLLALDETYRAIAQPPASVFVIGSCSDEEIYPSWWQDFDVHFLWDAVDVHQEVLAWMAAFLGGVRARNSATCAIDATLRDRHWKMTPNASVDNNIGIHATLLSRADHFRRVTHHPILSSNMYTRCRVLRGVHPGTANGWRRGTLADQLHGVGGLGWLSENFSRAVVMQQIDPTDRSFAPFLGGYCWNVVGAALFHLYTLTTGRITGRHVGLTHALEQGLLSEPEVEAARLVESRRLVPSLDQSEQIQCVNAAGAVLQAVHREFEGRLNLTSMPSPEVHTNGGAHLVVPGSFYSEIVTVRRNEDLPYWQGIEQAILQANTWPLSAKEDPEFILDAVAGGPTTKLRVVDRGFSRRLAISDDHRPRSLQHAVFGWESGTQAVLQRLNEWIVLGRSTSDIEQAALTFVALASERLSALGVRTEWGGPAPSGTASCRSWLAAQTTPHVPADLLSA